MEKLNIDYDIENADTTCPSCNNSNKRYWLKFYCNEVILVCNDCGYFEKI